MTGTFETSPISSVQLPGLSIELKGLIVLVGANSSGKTCLLRDIHAAASGAARQMVVADSVVHRVPPPLNDFLEFFSANGGMEPLPQAGSAPQYRKLAHQYGTQGGGPGSSMSASDLASMHSAFVQEVNVKLAQGRATVVGKELHPNRFLDWFGALECSALFIEHRLAITQGTPSFDTHQAAPTTALQALRVNLGAQEKLTEEMRRVFHRGVWLDLSAGGQLVLRVSDDEQVPDVWKRTDPKEMKKYRTIDTEGEGIRSYAAVCITLLLGDRPLCLIDEPEMCLHPPQARSLGEFIGRRFIGRKGRAPDGCTIVATHSSAVLRGILQTNSDASVVRLTRSASAFHARHVASATLREATKRPFSRSEIILDGLFTDGVAVCESDGDRVVYESTLQTLGGPKPDIRFVPVGGVGGFAHPVGLYRKLGVPVAVVADLDFLFQPQLRQVLSALGALESEVSVLAERAQKFLNAMREAAPELSPESAIAELRPILNGQSKWENIEKEAELRSKLSRIFDRLNRLSAVKKVGTAAVPDERKAEVVALLRDLQKQGLFIVPRGQLESWVPSLTTASKMNKSLWATQAAQKIEEAGPRSNDVWEFCQAIVNFVVARLAQSTDPTPVDSPSALLS